MSLTVIRRKDTNSLQIVGTVVLADGTRKRIRKAPQSENIKLAREEAAALEVEQLRTAWHGERRGAREFAEAIENYLDSAKRAASEQDRLLRISRDLGNVVLSAVNQEAIVKLKKKMFRREVSDATMIRELITPIRAVLRFAHRRGWCDAPNFEIPRQLQGRTECLMPAELKQLILAAAPHTKPVFTFLAGTGARVSEARELEWRDVDLIGATATFQAVRTDSEGNKRRGTKSGKRRIAHLPPVVVEALTALPHREGRVFRWQRVASKKFGKAPQAAVAYGDNNNRQYGGTWKKAWAGARRRAGLDAHLHLHDLRHTWASWHYALNRDLLALKVEGGWSSVTLVERYAHVMKAGYETEIRAWLAGIGETRHAGDTNAEAKSVST